MEKKEITVARQELLKAEIARQGLSVVSKLAGKPRSQINDMAAGRKSFGDGMARLLGPKIRTDLPRDWLIYPELGSDGSLSSTKHSSLVHDITWALDKARNLLSEVSEEEPDQNKELARVNAILTRIDAGELRSTEAATNEKQDEKVPARLQPLFARLISLKDNESLVSAIDGMIAAVEGKQTEKVSAKSIKPETNTSQREENHSSAKVKSIKIDDIMHPNDKQIDETNNG